MSLAILTSPEAVQAAISEFDKIGRDRFLQKYGYGNGEILLRLDDGKSYDAEAILAAAVGYQHPPRGPLKPSEFISSRDAIGDKLDELGFHVVDPYIGDRPTIRQIDIDLIASARQKAAQGLKYADLAQEERDAYSRVHDALAKLGEIAADELGQPDDVVVKLTSGFSPRSGVRGYLPKDLWFAVFPAENEDDLAGNPQIFMIVSERGVEYGFGAAVHPSDFSTQSLKDKVRETAPKIFERLPAARSQEAERISKAIEQAGKWFFRRKHRLEPNVSDFPTLNDLLSFLQSPSGAANSAGGISRYLHGAALDDTDLVEEVKNTAHLFEPLLLRDWHDDHGNTPLLTQPINHVAMAQTSDFSGLLDRFLQVFGAKRTGAFGIDTELREAIDGLQAWLESCDPVRNRPEINVVISVGKGNWTNTPWIALLDRRVTKTTQSGIYVVFLIAEDLSITYLTLNQGMTALVQSLGQKAAAHEMVRIATDARSRVRQLGPSEFQLDNNIDLRSRSSASKNYEVGTIAHSDLPAGHVPDDREMIDQLEWILNAYHHVTHIDEAQPSPDVTEKDVVEETMPAPPYSIDDAVEDLFVSREHVEKTIGIWRRKMNLILQGAPGVGK